MSLLADSEAIRMAIENDPGVTVSIGGSSTCESTMLNKTIRNARNVLKD